MKHKLRFAVPAILMLATVTVFAEPQGAPQPPSLVENLIASVVPFLLVAGIVWWVFIKTVRKMQQRSQEHIARQEQHNQRVELLLERIAKALEQADKTVG